LNGFFKKIGIDFMQKNIKESITPQDIDLGAIGMVMGELDADGFRFGIVVSRFNDELTGQLLKSALDCLRKYGASDDKIEVLWVPGAYEVPQAGERLLQECGLDALIALGCVIQGETPHAELINNSVAGALMNIARDHALPVINEVVGAYTYEQAEIRCRYGEDSRGWYAAAAAIEMASLFNKIGIKTGERL
jgi:6,7-dimethyl-8-ribityllumazine synthase